jgi:hypothetical protein
VEGSVRSHFTLVYEYMINDYIYIYEKGKRESLTTAKSKSQQLEQ